MKLFLSENKHSGNGPYQRRRKLIGKRLFFIILYKRFCFCTVQEEISLYDENLLLKLDFHQSKACFNPFISAAAPGEPWLKVRPLRDGDYNRGFLHILSQLTTVGEVSQSKFLSNINLIYNQ